MKIEDAERINDLLKARGVVLELLARVAAAEPVDVALMIERGGGGSIKLSQEGANSSQYQGYPVSPGYLARLKALALEELGARRSEVDRQLVDMGVDTDA